jgi:magnesium-transporting ATPase (P-type)
MCGDGANDAPALRQAQIGIAVSTATDVAKSAAGVVLTKAGLGGIVAAVKEGRVTFQRILTYTLNSVQKKVFQALLLAVGLVMTGHAVLTPMLMVIVMITGDFLAMSLTTDRVRPSKMPNSWQIGRITSAGVMLGLCFLAFSTAILAVGKFQLHLGIEALQTLTVVSIVFGSQATTYVIRGRQHLWGLRPSIFGSSYLQLPMSLSFRLSLPLESQWRRCLQHRCVGEVEVEYPCSFSIRPACVASSRPFSERSTSVQPVNRFSLFQMLSPWRSRTTLYIFNTLFRGFRVEVGSERARGGIRHRIAVDSIAQGVSPHRSKLTPW